MFAWHTFLVLHSGFMRSSFMWLMMIGWPDTSPTSQVCSVISKLLHKHYMKPLQSPCFFMTAHYTPNTFSCTLTKCDENNHVFQRRRRVNGAMRCFHELRQDELRASAKICVWSPQIPNIEDFCPLFLSVFLSALPALKCTQPLL